MGDHQTEQPHRCSGDVVQGDTIKGMQAVSARNAWRMRLMVQIARLMETSTWVVGVASLSALFSLDQTCSGGSLRLPLAAILMCLVLCSLYRMR